MFKSNHMEPDKITLVRRVDQALKQSLAKKKKGLQEYGF